MLWTQVQRSLWLQFLNVVPAGVAVVARGVRQRGQSAEVEALSGRVFTCVCVRVCVRQSRSASAPGSAL